MPDNSAHIENLKKIFEPYDNVQIEDILILFNAGEILEFDKNKVVKKQNQKENYLRFILSGVGGYFYQINNKEKCIYFIFKKDFFFDYNSVAFNIETKLILKTMTKTEMLVISKQKYYELCQQRPEIVKLQHIGLELLYKDAQEKYLELLTLNASERYKLLIKNRKDIMQNIDHKYIASFLGITPQSLSRLRKNIKL